MNVIIVDDEPLALDVLETYISVDVETAGPNPSAYSLLSIGATTLNARDERFYVEIQPVNDRMTEEAAAVSQLDLQTLAQHGLHPTQAMQRFADWVQQVVPSGSTPVFVAFNAAFDWMFITDYFYRYLGYNPFGHKALDIKAFYMGMQGVRWSETSMEFLAERYLTGGELTHHALADAVDQAAIFKQLLVEAGVVDPSAF